MKVSQHRSLRLVGWAAAYVLALHTILSSFVALPSYAATGADGAAILCLAGATHADDTGSGAPHGGGPHCAACVVAGVALTPPPVSPQPFAYIVAFVAEPPVSHAAPPGGAITSRPGNPRAPPILA
jgi:hypothetical protein